MFLSTVEGILLLVYFFDTIIFETSSFPWIINQSRFCVVFSDMFLSTVAVILIIV